MAFLMTSPPIMRRPLVAGETTPPYPTRKSGFLPSPSSAGSTRAPTPASTRSTTPASSPSVSPTNVSRMVPSSQGLSERDRTPPSAWRKSLGQSMPPSMPGRSTTPTPARAATPTSPLRPSPAHDAQMSEVSERSSARGSPVLRRSAVSALPQPVSASSRFDSQVPRDSFTQAKRPSFEGAPSQVSRFVTPPPRIRRAEQPKPVQATVGMMRSVTPPVRWRSAMAQRATGTGVDTKPMASTRLPQRYESKPSISPGDVLTVRGNGRLMNIGANGGLLGHVLLAVAYPEPVRLDSFEGRTLAALLSPAEAMQLLRLSVVESTRAHSGLHRSDLIVYIEAGTRRLRLLAEVTGEEIAIAGPEPELVEIWQVPTVLRTDFRTEIMSEVLLTLTEGLQDWSNLTAARALFRTADVTRNRSDSDEELLQEVSACWTEAPICTSVVVSFWQQYLCRYAKQASPAPGRMSEMELILRWMPLKADRALPGDLMSAMRRCGWTNVEVLN